MNYDNLTNRIMLASFAIVAAAGILLLPRESDGDGLGGPILRRVAACRSIERRFCWLRADAPLKQGCIEVSAYGRGLWGTERCAVP